MQERMQRLVREQEVEEDDVLLPGFRFHPTDEELVGFYLRRKVAKKPLSVEIIKEIDIYKYDPWDLPKVVTAGERELFFFCLRGRKYRNSIRPNRVTGSGFWKATGIDKPIYSAGGRGGSNSGDCIGLKKSLVYYRGSAGKGTKTEWMMHEFRLPSCSRTAVGDEINAASEAWTICRIFKRNVTYKKQTTSTWRASNNKQINNSNVNNNTDYSISSSITTTTTSFANSNSSSPSDWNGEMRMHSQEQEEQQNQLVYWNSIIQTPVSEPQHPDCLIQSPSMDELFSGDNCNWETELGGIMDYFMAD